MSIVSVKYNSKNFQTTASASAQILTRDILFESFPNKSFSLSQDSIRDGFSVVDSLYPQKMIILRGWLISDTPANFRTHDEIYCSMPEDEFKRNFTLYGKTWDNVSMANRTKLDVILEHKLYDEIKT